jgi:hypothetical protein
LGAGSIGRNVLRRRQARLASSAAVRFRSFANKRIDDPSAIVVLTGVQVFGEHHAATERAGGFDDRGVPVRQAKPPAGFEGCAEHIDGHFLNRPSQPRFEERLSLVV